MDIRGSFSKLKKKIKSRLPESKRKPHKAETELVGVDPTGSLPRPEPDIVSGGGSVDTPQQNEPASAFIRGDDGDRGGGEADIDREASRRYWHPHSEILVARERDPTEKRTRLMEGKLVSLHPPLPFLAVETPPSELGWISPQVQRRGGRLLLPAAPDHSSRKRRHLCHPQSRTSSSSCCQEYWTERCPG